MLALTTARWVLLRALRSPMALIAAACAILAVPAMIQLSPWVSGHFHGPVARLARVWLGPAGVLGCAFGLGILAQGEVFLLRFGARDRFWGILGGLVAPTLATQALILLGATLQGELHAQELLGFALVLDLHLLAVGLLIWALDLPPGGRLALFLGIVWLLPGLLADGGFLGRGAAPLVAPILSGESMGPFAAGAESALPWLLGQALFYVAAWLLLVPGKAPRA